MITLLREHGALSGSETNLEDILKVILHPVFAVSVPAQFVCDILQCTDSERKASAA